MDDFTGINKDGKAFMGSHQLVELTNKVSGFDNEGEACAKSKVMSPLKYQSPLLVALLITLLDSRLSRVAW